MNLLTSKAPPSQHIKFDVPFLPQKYTPKTLCLTFSNLRVTWGTNRFNIQQDSQCTYNVTLRCGRTAIVAVEKQWILRNLSVFATLVIQHAMRMHHTAICGLPRSAMFIFFFWFTFSHKRYDFRIRLLNTKCLFWFSLQLSPETFLILGRNEWDFIKKNVYWSSCKVSFMLVRF